MGRKSKEVRVDLLSAVRLIHRHLTAALCEKVFRSRRTTERRRQWCLEQMVQFWVAVILRAPDSLRQALEEARRGMGLFPSIATSDQAFFARCRDLRWEFFRDLLEAFTAKALHRRKPAFEKELQGLLERFPAVWVVDGSGLDAIAHRLKVLWDERAVVLPGCVTAFYDLFHGVPRRILFHAEAMKGELCRVEEALASVPAGALLVGDRAFGVVRFFASLTTHGLYGLSRHSKTVKLRRLKRFSIVQREDYLLEDTLVMAGVGANGVSPQTLRCIRLRRGRKVMRLLTNVLDPAMLPAEEALALYRRRWAVERLFFDLKEVLNLNRFYAANANAVAMQVYAAALVYVAMRVTQAHIATAVDLPPERLSPAKLFPRVATASDSLAQLTLGYLATRQVNPGVRLQEPDWDTFPFATVPLKSLLVEERKGTRRKRRYCKARRRHVSLHRFTPKRPRGRKR